MNVYKFKMRWEQGVSEMIAQDESRYLGKQTVESIINVVAQNEEAARFYLQSGWKPYSWLKREIVELISVEPVYGIAPLISEPKGSHVSDKVTSPLTK